MTGSGAGLFHAASGKLTLTGCVIADNTAKTQGSGLYVRAGGVAELSDCEVTRNHLVISTVGGGILVSSTSATLTNTFVWDNDGSQCAGNVIFTDGGSCGVAPPP